MSFLLCFFFDRITPVWDLSFPRTCVGLTRIAWMTRDHGFLITQLDRLLVVVGRAYPPDSNFFLENELSFHDQNLFHDRDDRGVPFLTRLRHRVDPRPYRNCFDLDALTCEILIDQRLALTGSRCDAHAPGFDRFLGDGKILGQQWQCPAVRGSHDGLTFVAFLKWVSVAVDQDD